MLVAVRVLVVVLGHGGDSSRPGVETHATSAPYPERFGVTSGSHQVTVSPIRPAIAAPDVETAIAAVRTRGLRISAARQAGHRGAVRRRRARCRRPRSPAGSTGSRRRWTSPPSTRTSSNSRTLGWSRTCTAATAPASTRCATASRERVPRVRALRCLPRGPAVGSRCDARAAIREATGFEARFSHFPIMGLCPDLWKEPHA